MRQIRAELHAGLDILKPSQELLEAIDELAPENDRSPHGSAERRAGRDRRRWRGRVRAAGAAVPVLIAVIAAVVVAGVVLTSVRHHHPTTGPPAAAGVAAKNGKVAFIDSPHAIFEGPTRSVHGVTWAFDALAVSNPNGSGRRNVGAYRCAAPTYACGVDSFAWSPDGKQIAYLAGHPASPNAPTSLALYLVGANGNGVRQLASCGDCSTADQLGGPSWSPDGSTIVLTRATGQAQDLWLVNVKTGTLRRLTGCAWGKACADEGAEWSPGGQAIVFSRSGKGHSEAIYTVRPDGTHLKLIVVDGQAPQWSPDGRKIAFQANNGIYTVNADGTQLTHILAAGPLASAPSWSPDGTKLLYQSTTDVAQIRQLWTINANGSENRRVYQQATRYGWTLSVWSPDGKQIAVSTNGGTFVVNADGSGVRHVGDPANQVAWQPVPLTHR